MKALGTLSWLRWRLLINESERKLSVSALTIVILLLCLSGGLMTGTVLRQPKVLAIEGEQPWIEIANSLSLSGVLILLLYKAISSGKLVRQLNARILRHYPIRDALLFFVNMIIGFFDVWYIAFSFLFLGFLVGLGAFAVSFQSSLILVLLFLAGFGGIHIFVETMREVKEIVERFPKTTRYALLIGLIVTVLYVLYASDQDLSARSFLRYTPIGWINTALYALVFRQEHAFLLEAFLESLALVLGCFIVFVALHNVNLARSSDQRSFPTGMKIRSYLIMEKIASVFPACIAPFLLRDLLYNARSKRIGTNFAISFSSVPIMIFVMKGDPKLSENYLFFLPIALMFPLTIWDSILSNCFGMDQSAFALYLFTSTIPKKLFIAKNIGSILTIIPSLIPTWVFLASILSVSSLPLIVFAQASILCLLLTFGNFRSVRFPFAVERNSTRASSTAAGNFSLLGLVGGFICFSFSIGIALLLRFFNTSFASYGIIFAVAIVTYFIYRESLSKVSLMFVEQAEVMHYRLRQR